MRYIPHPYQRFAQQYIVDNPACALFLDLGLGKTVITLTAIAELLHDRFEVARVLVVAPLRVARDTWPAEAAKWDHLAGLEVSAVVGTATQRREALGRSADVYVTNRENLVWLLDELDGQWPFDMVVIDELSSFKSRTTKRFKAMVRARSETARIVGLTGTPTPNGLLDLWPQFRILDEGERLGTHVTKYRERFFVPDKRNGQQIFSWKPRPGAERDIYRLIGDITVSMRTSDHLRLPELTSTSHAVRLGERDRRAYVKLRDELVLELDGAEIDAANAAVLSSKLLQLASGAIYDEDGGVHELHSRKLEALEDVVEAANGKSVLVAYWFKHERERILRHFAQAVALDSSADFRRWNDREIPVGLIHPASAGHGLNLQAGGSALVWFTSPWSLELYQQTNARLHRQGQSEPVTITHLVVPGSVDEHVLAALARKDTGQSALIDAVKASLPMKSRPATEPDEGDSE